MLTVNVLENAAVPDEQFAFAVIAARYDGSWLFVRHRERETWEIPGGHRETGETADEAAARELYEETGALEYSLMPICAYSVERDGDVTYGRFYFADVTTLGELPETEISEVQLFDGLPQELTYPVIQPVLFEKGCQFLESII